MSGVCGFGDFTQRALKSQKTIGVETNINQKTNNYEKQIRLSNKITLRIEFR
jgi:ribosomal protein S17